MRFERVDIAGVAGGPNGSSRPARALKEETQVRLSRSETRRVVDVFGRSSPPRFDIASPTLSWSVRVVPRCRSRRAPSRRRCHGRHRGRARGRANPRPATESRAHPAECLVHESGTSAGCRRRAGLRQPSAPSAATRMIRVPWTRMIHPSRPRARRRTRGVLRAIRARPSSPARRTTRVRRARTSSVNPHLDAKKQRLRTDDAGVRAKATSRRSPTAARCS
jgi:hypothetical protein